MFKNNKKKQETKYVGKSDYFNWTLTLAMDFLIVKERGARERTIFTAGSQRKESKRLKSQVLFFLIQISEKGTYL